MRSHRVLAALALLLVPVKGLPSFSPLAVLALPPLFMGLWLMRRFLQEPRQSETEQPSPQAH